MRQPPPRPWGKLAGLLAGCLVTLVGVAMNLDPLVILKRAVASGVCCGVVIAVASVVVRTLARQRRGRTLTQN